MKTIAEALIAATFQFEAAGISSARLDAEVLLAHLLHCSRSDLIVQRHASLTEDQIRTFESFMKRRKAREPVAYITGVKEFWSIPIHVTRDVLIPRPETEHLVETALEKIRNNNVGAYGVRPGDCQSPLQILDLCTGSGCIAAALAQELRSAHITATDISHEALEIARKNLHHVGAHGRAPLLLEGNLFEPVQEKFHLIVSNPPYGDPDEKFSLAPELQFEPQHAIFTDDHGMKMITSILAQAGEFLLPDGWLLMEISPLLADRARIAAIEYDWKHIHILPDLAALPRILVAQK